MPPETTRERILDAAEELFARQGISGTSLRTLTRHAGVNLAAVHYHFGSKEGLLDAVVERRATPINEAQTSALDRLVEHAGAGGPSPEQILRAYFRAVQDALGDFDGTERRHTLGRLMARIEAQPKEQLEQLYRRHLGEVSGRYVGALQHALPHLPPEQVADRFRFANGVMGQLLSGNMDLDAIPSNPPRLDDEEARVRHAIAFILAGFHAPAIQNDADENTSIDPASAKAAGAVTRREVACS
jgi:AcrR family transcriptional regulator